MKSVGITRSLMYEREKSIGIIRSLMYEREKSVEIIRSLMYEREKPVEIIRSFDFRFLGCPAVFFRVYFNNSFLILPGDSEKCILLCRKSI
jgi:hypothetical protein